MEGARDLWVISIPFTAGTATGAVLMSGALAGGGPGWTAAASSALLAAAGVIIICSIYKWRPVSVMLLFYLTGLFCCLSYGSISHGVRSGGVAAEAALSLKALIASVPFGHDETAPLLTAFLTGDRSGLGRDLTQAFRSSGASHILALSGLHLGVIYMLIRRLTLWTGNGRAASYIRCALILTTSGFYVVMTGSGPSIMRAWLYIAVNEADRLMPERTHDRTRTLLTALTIQLALRPAAISELGFQLSYLAMCGLTFVYPGLSSWYPDDGHPLLKRLDPMRRIWRGASLAISCQVFTAPLAWVRFHTFPKYFIITNLTALPLTGGIMVLTAAVLILYPAGICPEALIKVLDALVQGLLRILSTISSM